MKTGKGRDRFLRKAVCLAVMGMSLTYGAREAWAADYSDGDEYGTKGLTRIVGLEKGAYSKDTDKAVVTLSGEHVEILAANSNAVMARVIKKGQTIEIYPTVNVMPEKSFVARAKETAVVAQDGIVNIGSSAAPVPVVNLTTTGTYAAKLEPDQTLEAALSDNAYATIFARDLFGAGEVNIYAKDLQVLTAENTMTEIPGIKYGTALSGNGSGKINIHSTGTTVIKGAIEGYNKLLQTDGSSGIKININQDAGDIGKVKMEGLFISSAGKSEVNIKGSNGSSIKTDLVASASLAAKGNGGKIKLELLGADSTFTGNVTAQNGGEITLNVGKAQVGTVAVSGSTAAVNITGGTFTADNYVTNEGKITLAGGTILSNTEQMFTVAAGFGVNDAAGKKVSGLNIANGNLVLNDAVEFTVNYLTSVKNLLGAKAVVTLGKGNIAGLVENEKGQVSVSDLDGVGVNLAKVSATTNNQNLVVGGTDSSSASVGSLGVKNIDLGTASGVTVENGANLTLVGDGTGALVASTNGDVAVTLAGSTLNLGAAGTTSGGAISGSVNASEGSSVNVVGGNFAVTTLNADSSKVEVGTNGVLTPETLNASNGSALTVNAGAKVETKALTVTDSEVFLNGRLNSLLLELKVKEEQRKARGTFFHIGSNEEKGVLSVKTLEMAAGSYLFLDPAWDENGNTIAGASEAGIENFGSANIAGGVVVGQNSLLAAGSTDTAWAKDAFNKNTANWVWGNGAGQVGAALALKTSQMLAPSGTIVVDGTLTSLGTTAANTANFAQDSLLIIDAAGVGAMPALRTDSNAALTVANGAKLLVANAKDGAKVASVYGFLNNNQSADTWALATDDRNLAAAFDSTTPEEGDILIKVAANSAMQSSVVSNIVNKIYADGTNNVNSTNPGIAFLSQASNTSYLAIDSAAVAAVNSAAGMTALGGQQSSTLNGAKLFTGAIQNHLMDKPEGDYIWAQYIHSNSKLRDVALGSGKFGFDNKFNGVVVGGDFLATATKHAGAAFMYGEGKVSGDYATTNNYKFWGLDVYHAWHLDKAVVMADLGYMKNDGEIKQANALGNLSGDPTSSAWTLGVRGDFKVAKDSLTPYVGLRYVRLATDSHSINGQSGAVFNVGKDTQNIWLFPVGVEFSKKMTKGKGIFTPKVDLGLIFAFGDKDTKSTISVPDVAAGDTLGVQVTDATSFLGSVGFTYETKKFNYGLAYQLQAGSKETRNGVWANIEYKF